MGLMKNEEVVVLRLVGIEHDPYQKRVHGCRYWIWSDSM